MPSLEEIKAMSDKDVREWIVKLVSDRRFEDITAICKIRNVKINRRANDRT